MGEKCGRGTRPHTGCTTKELLSRSCMVARNSATDSARHGEVSKGELGLPAASSCAWPAPRSSEKDIARRSRRASVLSAVRSLLRRSSTSWKLSTPLPSKSSSANKWCATSPKPKLSAASVNSARLSALSPVPSCFCQWSRRPPELSDSKTAHRNAQKKYSC